jgi:hypothetical protein
MADVYSDIYDASVSAYCTISWGAHTFFTYHLTDFRIIYAVNKPPRAEFSIPYGYCHDFIAARTPSSRFTPKVFIRYLTSDHGGGSSYTTLFDGYIIDLSAAEKRAPLKGATVVNFQAVGSMSLLSQQLTSITRGDSPVVYDGSPFLSSITGVPVDAEMGKIYGDGSDNIIDFLYDLFTNVLDSQEEYSLDWEAGTRGEELARDALDLLDTSPLAHPPRWPPFALLPTPLPGNKGSGFFDGQPLDYDLWTTDDTTRRAIAWAVVSSFSQPGAFDNLWGAILNFCRNFGFMVVPQVDSFYIVPSCRLADPDKERWWDSTYEPPLYTDDEIAGFHIPKMSAAVNALRQVAVIAETSSWGLYSEKSQVGGYDLGKASVHHDEDRAGRTISIPMPKWVPPYGSIGEGISNLLAQQKALDEAYGHQALLLRLPYLSRISPGSHIRLQSSKLSKIFGTSEAYALVVASELIMSQDGPDLHTDLRLSHVMNDQLYDNISMVKHPLTKNAFMDGVIVGQALGI